jgi:hypothetical protein
MTTKYFLIGLVILLTSCDPGSKVFYDIDNQTGKQITIEYYYRDTTAKTTIILPNQSRQIIFHDEFLGYADKFDRLDSVDIDYHVKIKVDTAILNINLKDKKNWSYIKRGDTEGWCTLTLK